MLVCPLIPSRQLCPSLEGKAVPLPRPSVHGATWREVVEQEASFGDWVPGQHPAWLWLWLWLLLPGHPPHTLCMASGAREGWDASPGEGAHPACTWGEKPHVSSL